MDDDGPDAAGSRDGQRGDDADRLAAAAAAAFPGRTVARIDPRDTRPGNVTGLVVLDGDERVYLKTATDGSRRLVREAAATRYAGAHCPVEVPTVRAADPAGDPPFLATDPLPGTALGERWPATDLDARADLLRAAGGLLAGVHEARFDRPGRIVGGDADALDLRGESWSETLAATVEERGADLFADRFARMPERLAAAVREAAPLLDEGPADGGSDGGGSGPGDAPFALLHGDPNRPNCLLDPPGLLDWERAIVGDPGLEVVDAASHLAEQPDLDEADQEPLREALHAGYRERAGSLPAGLARRRPVYRAVAFLLTPQTFELWAPQVDQPTDDLAAWVREEFDERLAALRDAVG